MRAIWLAAVAAAVLLAGCEAESGKPAATRKATPDAELTEATADALDRAVRECKGSVVLVDFWALWCGPCLERFPHLVALHRKYSDLGLVCVSVNLDPPERVEAVRDFLTRQRAAFPNFLVTDHGTREGDKKLAAAFGLTNAIPFMAVFDRDGRRVWAGTGSQMTPSGLDAIIGREIDRKATPEGR